MIRRSELIVLTMFNLINNFYKWMKLFSDALTDYGDLCRLLKILISLAI